MQCVYSKQGIRGCKGFGQFEPNINNHMGLNHTPHTRNFLEGSSQISTSISIWGKLFGEQFRQITHYLAEQFGQITHNLLEHFRQITHYLAEQFR